MNSGGAPLDWSHPDLLNAFEADSYNGFGFQCEPSRSCLYIGQPFLAEPQAATPGGFPSCEINETQFLQDIHARLASFGIAPEGVWITDYLGRDFLTIHSKHYNDIPRIINACLECGYKFITHGEWKAQFVPGDSFTRASYELKLIETLEHHAVVMRECIHGMDYTSIYSIGIRPFLKHWNYATPQGRAFCTRLRKMLRKRKETSGFKDRFTWPKYCETAEKYGVLHKGGWAQYDPGVYPTPPKETPFKRSSPERSSPERSSPQEDVPEEEVCMICLDRPPSTMVLPCGHVVVCAECSKKLVGTPDKHICVQCRKPITEVLY